MAWKIKKDDMVVVITGADRDLGHARKVLRVDRAKGKIVVEGVNRVYKHVKPSRRNPQGGRLQIEQPIDMSNVKIFNSRTNKGTRVGFAYDEKGQKLRIAKDDGKTIHVIRKAK